MLSIICSANLYLLMMKRKGEGEGGEGRGGGVASEPKKKKKLGQGKMLLLQKLVWVLGGAGGRAEFSHGQG